MKKEMSEGFKKINLNSGKIINKTPENKINKKSKLSKLIFITLAALVVIIVFFTLAVIIPAKSIYTSAQNSSRLALEAFATVKNQDIDKTSAKLKETETSLNEVQQKVNKLSWFKVIPFIGVYQSDMESMVKAAIAGVQAGEITAETISPYSDLLGLKGKSTFVSGSADDRIKTAVETLDKVTPRISEISQKINIIGQELDKIDSARYPEKIGNNEVRSRIKSAKDIFSQTANLFVEAQPLLVKLPDLLGNKGPKTYLFIFQNDAELRATGGFITAYALFNVDKGKMKVVKADDIYKLDEAKKKTFPAPAPILKYHKNVKYFELRDSNLSPDFSVSMKQFESMLRESVPDFPQFDGIISFDTHVLVSAIKILGDFNIYGRNFSAENDPRCDCPKVIYEMEDYSTKPVAYVREDRKDIIGVFMYQIMQRALGVSPSKYWGSLFQMFLDESKQKHIFFYFKDADAQKGIEGVNFGGRIVDTKGDYLHINNVNFAGAKSNLFVRSSVKQEINQESDGLLTKTVTVNYKNPAQASNCNLEAGQLCLNGILRNWVRIYVPLGSKLIDFSGSEMDTATYDEAGKTVFEGFLTVKPQGASEIKIKYSLPPGLKDNTPFKIYIQKQPGTDKEENTVLYKGRQIDKFELLTDKEISFKL